MWDSGPALLVFAILWLPWCTAYRLAVDKDGPTLQLDQAVDATKLQQCPEEQLEKYRTQLRGLGLRGDGNPCKWKGVACEGCSVVSITSASERADGDLQYLQDMTDLKRLFLSKAALSGDIATLGNLSKLRSLSLPETKVWGDIWHLRNLRNLNTLWISRTAVSGDIGALQGLTKLGRVRLSHNDISGDVASLRNLIRLQDVELQQTRVSGDLGSLRNLTMMVHLWLATTEVSGDVKDLQHLHILRSLDLSKTRVFGDVAVFQHLSNLHEIFLGHTKIAGDIGSFANLYGLRDLELQQTQVSGNIASLRNVTSLYELCLSHTQVSGNVASLEKLTSLRKLEVTKTHVWGNITLPAAASDCPEDVLEKHRRQLRGLGLEHHGNPCAWEGIIACDGSCEVVEISSSEANGDLQYVKDMTHLKVLHLQHSDVSGDVGALQNLTGMKLLDLSETKIFGHIGSLRSLTAVKAMLLANTQVSGDIEAFQDLTRLQWLHLGETRVSGNLRVLQKMTQLTTVSLSRTGISGDVRGLQKASGLRILEIDHTQVSGDIVSFQNLEQLTDLVLVETKVSGDLGTLQKLTAMQALDLFRTEVSGDVGSLRNLVRLNWLHLDETQVSGDVSSLQNLTSLRELELAHTQVEGKFSVISWMDFLEKVDLSKTMVFGNLGDLKPGCCKKLRHLNLAETRFGASSGIFESLLPALQSLNVSGCHLNVRAEELLIALADSPVATLRASGCGLTGFVPNLRSLTALMGDRAVANYQSPLGDSLQLMDLSDNGLEEVNFLPVHLRLDLSRSRRPLRLGAEVISEAARAGVDLRLINTTLANPEDMINLSSTLLKATDQWVSRNSGGYACHDLAEPNFRVTPEFFMPQELCACRPGFFGTGTHCSECPVDTYNEAMNQSRCNRCPSNSYSPAGSTSVTACACQFGSVEKIGSDYVCACGKNEAQTSEQRCVPCSEVHLICEEPGELVATAPVQSGFIRLQEPSEEIFQCFDRKRCRNSSCTSGHVGPLCADCAARFRAAGGGCIECKNLSLQQKVYVGFGGAAMLLILAAMAWNFRHRLPSLSDRQRCLLQLLAAQSAVLLQVTQLWTVLGRLPRQAPGSDLPNASHEDDNSAEGDPFLLYLEMLQFTSSELQDLLALQCLYDGVTVRMLFALATPLVPLLLLLICACVEIFSPGFGIRIGLKTLTVLFIGGAGGSAQLLGCQRTDAAGLPLNKFAFRPLFPHQLCDEAPWVDAVGWATAACYGLLIPAFLGFLFVKQNVVMRKTRTVFTETTVGKGRLTVRLRGLESEKTCEEQLLGKRLAAAAAAYVANHVTGRAVVELQKDAVIVVPLVESAAAVSDDLTDFRTVESLVFGGDCEEAQVLQRHATAQMLMERSILEEESDRFMLGASHMFSKYAKCENVWMEVCSKVAAAALVSVVAVDGLWLCVAITLGMAVVTSLAQPFAQPQLNNLQATGFTCLAVAAVGFRHRVLVANLALAVPFVLMVLQLRRPDSVEMLALRLQQELESKIHEGPVEVSAERFA